MKVYRGLGVKGLKRIGEGVIRVRDKMSESSRKKTGPYDCHITELAEFVILRSEKMITIKLKIVSTEIFAKKFHRGCCRVSTDLGA